MKSVEKVDELKFRKLGKALCDAPEGKDGNKDENTKGPKTGSTQMGKEETGSDDFVAPKEPDSMIETSRGKSSKPEKNKKRVSNFQDFLNLLPIIKSGFLSSLIKLNGFFRFF